MPRNQAPLRIALVYVVAGALWISMSDWLLLSLSPEYFRVGQAVKGIAFVLLSGVLIFTLVRRELQKRVKLEAEQEQLRTRLAGSQRLEAIGRLTGGIAHDFNNLLTAISGNLESYMSRTSGQSRTAPDGTELEEAASAARRAAELTRQLLAFGRRQELRPQPLDLNDVIRDMERLLHRLIGDTVEMDTRLQDDLWVVNVDRGPLQQVVMNLALNARDAMTDHGRLTVSTLNMCIPEGSVQKNFDFPMAAGDYVRLRVEDTGTGMDAETRERIYEPFFTTKEKHVGTGLGMSTVYGIVKQSGGYIDLRTTLGEGTRFDLYFPRGEGVPHPLGPATPPSIRLDGTETVLVVEDEPAVRSVIVRTLHRHGFKTVECASGWEALEILSSDTGASVQLLLTDAVMPGMSGTELIQHARALCTDLSVLLMSGYTETEVDADAPYLPKPFTGKQLVTRIRQTLDVD